MSKTEVRYWLCIKSWRFPLWKDKYLCLSFDKAIDGDDIEEVIKAISKEQ